MWRRLQRMHNIPPVSLRHSLHVSSFGGIAAFSPHLQLPYSPTKSITRNLAPPPVSSHPLGYFCGLLSRHECHSRFFGILDPRAVDQQQERSSDPRNRSRRNHHSCTELGISTTAQAEHGSLRSPTLTLVSPIGASKLEASVGETEDQLLWRYQTSQMASEEENHEGSTVDLPANEGGKGEGGAAGGEETVLNREDFSKETRVIAIKIPAKRTR